MLCCVTRTESRQADPLVCKQQQHQKRLNWLSPKGSLNMAKSCYGRSPRAQHTLYCCTGLQLRHDCLAMTLEGFCKPAVLLTKPICGGFSTTAMQLLVQGHHPAGLRTHAAGAKLSAWPAGFKEDPPRRTGCC